MGPPGSGDCEARSEVWGQPVLAVSSLAYVIVGLWVLIWGLRNNRVNRWETVLFAGALMAAGLGSADYHGPAIGPEPLLHDGGLALALVVAFGIDLRTLGFAARPIVWWLAGGTTILLGVIAIIPVASPALAGVAALGLVIAEILIYRRSLRTIQPAFWVGVGALAIGVVVFSLSRTGGPWCQPDSWLQGHGLWHVLTAVALGCWGYVSLPRVPADPRSHAPRVAS